MVGGQWVNLGGATKSCGATADDNLSEALNSFQVCVAMLSYTRRWNLRHPMQQNVAVILDSFSRKVVGWKLGRTLMSRLATVVLEQAIEARQAAVQWFSPTISSPLSRSQFSDGCRVDQYSL